MATHSNGKIQPRQPIAIVRLDDLEQAVEISRALLAGGITAQEFTLTNPHALEALAQRGDPRLADTLASHLSDKNQAVRCAAAAGFIRLSSAKESEIQQSRTLP